MVYDELNSAYETLRLLTGRPPTRFVVARDAVALLGLKPGSVLVLEHTWRSAVAGALKDCYGTEQPDTVVEAFMRKSGWTYRGVSIDTSRLTSGEEGTVPCTTRA